MRLTNHYQQTQTIFKLWDLKLKILSHPIIVYVYVYAYVHVVSNHTARQHLQHLQHSQHSQHSQHLQHVTAVIALALRNFYIKQKQTKQNKRNYQLIKLWKRSRHYQQNLIKRRKEETFYIHLPRLVPTKVKFQKQNLIDPIPHSITSRLFYNSCKD